MTDYRVLILAAGRGSRFLAAGGTGHKALAPVAGTTPLLWTLEVLGAAGAPPVRLVLGCRAEQLRAAVLAAGYPGPVSFVLNEQWERTDSAYSFALGVQPDGSEQRDQPVLLSYADVLLTPAVVARLADQRDRNLVVVDTNRHPSAWDMRAQVVDGRVAALSKTLPAAASDGESACFFRFTPAAAAELARLGRQALHAAAPVQFERMLDGVLAEIFVEPVWCGEDEWCEVDVPAELPLAQHVIERALAAQAAAAHAELGPAR